MYTFITALTTGWPVMADDRWRHHDGWGGDGWWWLWGASMMLFWVAVIVGVVWLFTRHAAAGPVGHSDPHSQARAILAQRYARGELSTEEYHERLDSLR